MTAAKKQSAGILLYRFHAKELEVLLVHPGGPFWKNKDAGSWTIPKGEFVAPEEPFDAACRELEEETGYAPTGPFLALTPVKQKSGKLIFGWACPGNLDVSSIKSNEFLLEWPPRSGKMKSFPEIDRAAWFTLPVAKEKLNVGQTAFLTELLLLLGKE